MSKKQNKKMAIIAQSYRQNYINKYFNLWMSKFKWSGLDEEQAEQQQDYIMRKFYSKGNVACFPIKNTDLIGFAPFFAQTFNMYDYPATVELINTRNVAQIPKGIQVVNRDVVIGYAQANKKPIEEIVNHYIDVLVSIDMVINTNLQLQKMPWLVAVNPEDVDRMKEVVRQILNDELVVFTDIESLSKIQTLATNTPYIINKLSAHKHEVERELMTFLGIDNDGGLTQTHMTVDTVNASNHEINEYNEAIISQVKSFVENINRTFGRSITVEEVVKPVESYHEEVSGNKSSIENGGNDDE